MIDMKKANFQSLKAEMEINSNPFARGDQFYDRMKGFRSKVAHLAYCIVKLWIRE